MRCLPIVLALGLLLGPVAGPAHAQRSDSTQLRKFQRANEFLRADRPERALPLLESLYSNAPENAAFYRKLKQAYESLKRYRDALHVCRTGAGHCGQHPGAPADGSGESPERGLPDAPRVAAHGAGRLRGGVRRVPGPGPSRGPPGADPLRVRPPGRRRATLRRGHSGLRGHPGAVSAVGRRPGGAEAPRRPLPPLGRPGGRLHHGRPRLCPVRPSPDGLQNVPSREPGARGFFFPAWPPTRSRATSPTRPSTNWRSCTFTRGSSTLRRLGPPPSAKTHRRTWPTTPLR